MSPLVDDSDGRFNDQLGGVVLERRVGVAGGGGDGDGSMEGRQLRFSSLCLVFAFFIFPS